MTESEGTGSDGDGAEETGSDPTGAAATGLEATGSEATGSEATEPEAPASRATVSGDAPEADLETYVSRAASPTVPGRRRGARVAAVIGVVTALVAGVLAVATLNTAGGSSTPEDAVRELAAALAEEDVLGALEALVPGERAVLAGRIADLAKELGRLGLLDQELDLGDVPGLDLGVDALELRTEAMGDGVAAVVVTGGTVRLAVDDAALPVGPVARDLQERSDGAELSARPPPVDLSDHDVRLVALREEGEWFVSLGYTAAEAARRASGAAAPSPQQRVSPRGEASPEAVVRETARAAAAFDARRLVELTAPGEAAALHSYAPLFLPAAERAAEEARGSGVRAEVSSLEVSTDGSGTEARVTVDRLGVRLTTAEGPASFDYDGRCSRYTGPDDQEPVEVCADDPELQSFGAFGLGSFSLTTVERDGAWYISPVGTYLDSILAALRAADRAEVERAVADDGPFALAALFSAVPFALLGGFAGSTVHSEQGHAQACTVSDQEGSEAGVPCPTPPAPPVPMGAAPVTTARSDLKAPRSSDTSAVGRAAASEMPAPQAPARMPAQPPPSTATTAAP